MLETWRPALIIDESTGDSDKTFTVPDRRSWQVSWIWAELATKVGGTAGNRRLEIEIMDTANDIIAEVHTDTLQTSDATRFYLFAPGAADLASFRDTDFISFAMPALTLSEGFQIRIFDNAAVAADSDDLVIQMMVQVKGERRRMFPSANVEPSS